MAEPRSGAGSGDYEVGHCKPPKEYQFKKGQSGNPGGKPKGYEHQATVYQRLRAMSPEEYAEFRPRTMGEEMAQRVIDRTALGGEEMDTALRHVQEIHDRADGKPRQTMEKTLSTLERPTDRETSDPVGEAMQLAAQLRKAGFPVPEELQARIEGAED